MTTNQNDSDFYASPIDFQKSLHLKTWKSALLAILSGILMAICYEPLNLSFLAWVCIIPFWFGLRGRKDKGVFWLGCLLGYTFFLVSLFWIRSILLPVPFLLSLVWTPMFGFWAWFTRKMYFYLAFPDATETLADAPREKFILPWKKLLLLSVASASLFTMFDWMRFWLMTGFPWNQLGVSQAYNLSILPVASFFGIPGITFIIIFINMSLALSLETKWISKATKLPWQTPLLAIIISSSIVIGCNQFKVEYKPNTSFKASLIQGYFFPERTRRLSQEEVFEYFQTYTNLTLGQIPNKPDLILWPETALPASFTNNSYYQNTVKKLTQKANTPMLLGSSHFEFEDGKTTIYNTAFLTDNKGKEVDRYYKIHLVPYGEYTPMKNILPESIWNFLNGIVNMGNLGRGEEFNVMSLNDDIKMGVNICFEDVFPDVSQAFVRNGANLLVTLTNDSWYLFTSGGAQHTVHSIFRAVENGLPLLRCGTTSESCLILPSGEVTHLIVDENNNRITRGAKTIDVPVSTDFTPTFYYKNPNFFSNIMIFITSIAFLVTGLHFYKKKCILQQLISGNN
ncbi:MAG: apolipoprotein N-acyltransferase [Lentisphaeraceae bacterium]|nr:apolipoprotein N-acyltransferase [Lentisphaeraceae bacterium]